MLNLLLKNANVYFDDVMQRADILIKDGVVVSVAIGIFADKDVTVVDCDNYYILPGFADVHVHLREPGFFYKESIKTGTQAAAKGGFTLVCSMPNLNPVPDSMDNLKQQLDIIKSDAVINVIPYGAITKGQNGTTVADMQEMSENCCAFTDDGKGVQNDDIMEKAMNIAVSLDKLIVAHCEDESLLLGGYIHKGEYAKLNGHRGISSESEYIQVERDIALATKTGVKYHICHVSTKETVELVRKAKKRGIDITCETAPHYLAFCDMDLKEDGRFKMNPPIRSAKDRDALIEGIKDGTIEIIATDHAPHSLEEKTKGLEKSNMGVSGIEISFAAMNEYMVKRGHIDYKKLIEIMSINPRKRFEISSGIQINAKADLAIVDTEKVFTVKGEDFISKGKFTPFEGKTLTGEVVATIYNGKLVYNNQSLSL